MRVIRQPEPFAADNYEELVVNEQMIDYTADRSEAVGDIITTEVPLTPKSLVYDMTLRIKIYGIHNLRSIQAALTGVAEGRVVSSEIPNSTNATHILVDWTQEGSYGEGYIKMPFTSFGLRSNPNSEVVDYEDWSGEVTLIVLLIDNSTMTFTLPMDSSNIAKSDGALSLSLEVGMSINPDEQVVLPDVEPEDPKDGGGFDATVEEWGDEEELEIPL